VLFTYTMFFEIILKVLTYKILDKVPYIIHR